jgi:hypothetical protein
VACIWFARPAPTARFAELFLRFSPQICLRGEQALFIEIGKCQNLYSEAGFLMRAAKLLQRMNLSAVIKVGQDLPESLVLAKYNGDSLEALPLEALLEMADPFLRDENLRKSVQVLIESFRNLGIQTLGHFKKIPVADLIGRFGVVGRFCYQRVRLESFVTWPLWQPEEIILERKEFSYFEFYGELDPILFELKNQLDSVFARLFARKKRLMKLQVVIACEKISTHLNPVRTLDFEFFAPQSLVKGTLRILKERLSREFEKNPILSPIESVQTKVLKAVPFEGGQKNIFNTDEEKLEQLHSIHNQLIEMLGKESIYQAELTEDRRPERSWVKRLDRPHEPSDNLVDLTDVIPERPTYLCRQPVKIEVTAGYVHINKRRYKILHWDDQIEIISGGWFENPLPEIKNSFDRTYSQVEIEGHQKISVFQTTNCAYYLHGYYG